MDLIKVSNEIKTLLEEKRKNLSLVFEEDNHTYHMKDVNGKLRNDFPSVSKIIKKFYKPFDAEGVALKMSNGDIEGQKQLLEQWKLTGEYSTNLGSRVHFLLEKELINQYQNYKELRQPIFDCDEKQIFKSDNMIEAGKSFLSLMHERGGVLLDTEIVLGDNELGYTGQPDKVWLMLNKSKTDFGFVITDYKTNQPKNFEVQRYTKKMFRPFESYHDTALSHYYLQLPLYARLLLKMLEGTEYESKKLLGCVIVLLKEDSTFKEYKVPNEVINIVMNLNLDNYIK